MEFSLHSVLTASNSTRPSLEVLHEAFCRDMEPYAEVFKEDVVALTTTTSTTSSTSTTPTTSTKFTLDWSEWSGDSCYAEWSSDCWPNSSDCLQRRWYINNEINNGTGSWEEEVRICATLWDR